MSKGRADAPIRIRSGAGQKDIERTTIRGCVVRITAPVGETETGRALYPYVSKTRLLHTYTLGRRVSPDPSQESGFNERDAPLYQLATEAGLFKATQNAPQPVAGEFEAPPRQAKRRPDA